MGRMGRLGRLGRLGRMGIITHTPHVPHAPHKKQLLTPHYSLSVKGLSLECYALAIGRYEYHAALGACYVTYDIHEA